MNRPVDELKAKLDKVRAITESVSNASAQIRQGVTAQQDIQRQEAGGDNGVSNGAQ